MFAKLKGIVDSITEDSVVLDVGGVGYQAFCSVRTLGSLIPGEVAILIIETHVREDHIHLYGFASTTEREWFRLLCTVQRVGSKMALSLLNAMTPSQMLHAIIAKDTTTFSRISGVGAKLAERLVIELKDKALKMPTEGDITSFAVHADTTPVKKGKTAKAVTAPAIAPTDEAISALLNLGYSRSEAYAATLNASKEAGGSVSLDKLITLSLKELAR